MHYRFLSFCLGTFLIATAACAQLQRIVVQGNGVPQVYSNITDAIAAAQPNDKLYFSGGTFPSDGFALSIPLHFIGAGVHPDSTNVTAATILTTEGGNEPFTITTGASGSTFTGINFNPVQYFRLGNIDTNDDPTDLVFERCSFNTEVWLGWIASSASSSIFNECIFYEVVRGQGGEATFNRCVFDDGATITLFTSPLILRNSVVLNSRLQDSQDAIVQNCIFTYPGPPLWQVSGVQITNCIINSDAMFSNSSGNVETGTIHNQTPEDIFVSETDNAYQFTDDLHLLPGSPGIGAGNDGTDIGIYGSSSPYKPGNVPYNPHYRQASIATGTDANGDLPVTIKVATQPN